MSFAYEILLQTGEMITGTIDWGAEDMSRAVALIERMEPEATSITVLKIKSNELQTV